MAMAVGGVGYQRGCGPGLLGVWGRSKWRHESYHLEWWDDFCVAIAGSVAVAVGSSVFFPLHFVHFRIVIYFGNLITLHFRQSIALINFFFLCRFYYLKLGNINDKSLEWTSIEYELQGKCNNEVYSFSWNTRGRVSNYFRIHTMSLALQPIDTQAHRPYSTG